LERHIGARDTTKSEETKVRNADAGIKSSGMKFVWLWITNTGLYG